jgi:ABC-type antimicrobial peptide transport system permease subunit
LAIGSQPREILTGVVREGFLMGAMGVVCGVAAGLALWRLADTFIPDTQLPGVVATAGAAVVLLLAAIIASLLPAARASRVDAMQALRAE